MFAYLPIYLAAILEGEIYYISACGLAISGRLHWFPVLIAGALGGATGDQIWFYVLRGRVDWLNRYPKIARYRNRVSAHVHAHEGLIILASRFLPGLRTAIPVACAYADVRPLKFSTLNLISAVGWASALMLLVKLGSSTLTAFGLREWWGPFIPAALLIAFFVWLSRPSRPRRTP
jgi:membrane protein DedA with SNARE-associated domain